MMIAVVLFIYSIYEMLKFLFFATLGDIVTTIKGNYDSPERDQAVNDEPQLTVVHIDAAAPGDLAGVNAQSIALIDLAFK